MLLERISGPGLLEGLSPFGFVLANQVGSAVLRELLELLQTLIWELQKTNGTVEGPQETRSCS